MYLRIPGHQIFIKIPPHNRNAAALCNFTIHSDRSDDLKRGEVVFAASPAETDKALSGAFI